MNTQPGERGEGEADNATVTSSEGRGPERPPCLACGRTHGRRRRRGCCIACYRKFVACRVPLPDPPPPDLPRWLMDRMTEAQRDRARLYLGELAARAARP